MKGMILLRESTVKDRGKRLSKTVVCKPGLSAESKETNWPSSRRQPVLALLKSIRASRCGSDRAHCGLQRATFLPLIDVEIVFEEDCLGTEVRD